MSLIQQALDKTNRPQVKQTAVPAVSPKPWMRDPMGEDLEKQLIEIQQAYARRRSFYWKISMGVLLTLFVSGLFYFGQPKLPAGTKIAPTPGVAKVIVTRQSPLNVSSGVIYRLTGITKLSGKSMAVINERIVGVGDPLDGVAVVKSIGDGTVVLDIQGQEIKLTL